ncbi:chemotaxis protein CheX [Leptospira kemamanensis]|uniref:Chemotaxis protein CheX n=1 Tax=Leptospira kemamanensis TaxID=2484942 RepID=A0A4R9JN21_9LEPT|nr:chemotaxis protein CheX [Leptospira kemamanensis]TGL51354.1 chemotaxis protein CheX [Leptospira kemamanensis]
MDPLIDEKFILTVSQVLPDHFYKTLLVFAEREAYGPSKNEGLCFENCTLVEFVGDINGKLYLALDGYTKLKLLPKIAKAFQIDPTSRAHSASIMMEFANQIAGNLITEMLLGRYEIDILPPENLNHKLVPISLEHFRQYILIFNLKDRRGDEYMGRLYLILLLEKFPTPQN